MGYNTAFTLTIGENADLTAILAFIKQMQNNDIYIDKILYKKNPDFCYPLEDGTLEYYGKWYESNSDMKILSKAFPDVLFILRGFGEDDDDVWKYEYLNGNVTENTPVYLIPRDANKSLYNLCMDSIIKNPSIINSKIPADLWEKLILEITRNNFSKVSVNFYD